MTDSMKTEVAGIGPADIEPGETAAAQAGAEIEKTTDGAVEAEHTVQTEPGSDEEKRDRDYLLTTDPQAQNRDTVIEPTNS